MRKLQDAYQRDSGILAFRGLNENLKTLYWVYCVGASTFYMANSSVTKKFRLKGSLGLWIVGAISSLYMKIFLIRRIYSGTNAMEEHKNIIYHFLSLLRHRNNKNSTLNCLKESIPGIMLTFSVHYLALDLLVESGA